MHPSENQEIDMVGVGQNRWTPELRQTVGLVQSQLTQLLQQRAAVVKRIAMVRRAIEGLNSIFAEPAGEPAQTTGENGRFRDLACSSLTAACRAVLRNSTRPLTAHDTAALLRTTRAVTDENLDRHVASICRRLVVYGEATVTMTDSGRRAWAWRTDRSTSSLDQSSEFHAGASLSGND
jgi:hypothetical protein